MISPDVKEGRAARRPAVAQWISEDRSRPSINVQASRRFGTQSPLRYPGGKAALAGLFSDIISDLDLAGGCYVEPYAGGAGAGVALLREGIVNHVVVNDIDPAVHAFWLAATSQSSALIDKLWTTPLTVSEWQRQRDIYRAKVSSDALSLGFAFFYLNRTNRSGILNAGVIGGQTQTGTYKIDARFNRETLTQRLKAIADLADQITVLGQDGRTVIERYGKNKSVFLYIDPPYVHAGSQLYLNGFDGRDHIALSKVVLKSAKAAWLVTYDQSPLIEKLYQKEFQCNLRMNYSARYPGKAGELLVASPRVAKAIQRIANQTLMLDAEGGESMG